MFIMAFAIILVASCQVIESPMDDAPEDLKNYRTLTVGVSEEPDTRVGFDENNSFYWHRGDKVGVQTAAGFKEMILDDKYYGFETGVFVGDFMEELGDYVVYPFGMHVLEEGILTYVLPASYTYESIIGDVNSFNPPMFGEINGTMAMLRHLASFFKITVNNITAGGSNMKFVLTTDKRINGEFLVNLLDNPPVLLADEHDGKSVTINFSNDVSGTTGVFYVPAPLGTYGFVTVEIFDGEQNIATKTWTNQTVKRRIPKRGTVDVEYVAEINGALYQSRLL